MRTIASLLTLAFLSISAAGVFAQDMMYGTGLYASAGGGISLITDTKDTPQVLTGTTEEKKDDWDFDIGFGAGGAVGYDFGEFRVEGEFSYQSAGFLHGETISANDQADDSLAAMAIMANGFFDLDTGSAFFPYIGIGAGAVNLAVKLAPGKDKTPEFDGNGWGFGYQANLGVAYQIIDEIALTLGYKFFGTLATEVKDLGGAGDEDDESVTPTLMAHRAELGVRFSF